MANRLKELVSKNKIRYQADGFDLDLAYITKNIIAMGFPAENLEGVYRNHLEDVQRFLETKHEKCYKIYNLCLEREYLPNKFKGPVTKYPFKDHNPPPLMMMVRFCEDVRDWLAEDIKNVAVIHCKAGKGRTGVMICAYLVYSENWSADQALSFYGQQRTKDSKGVTIPSQRRYVHYYSRLLKDHTPYSATPLRLVAFKFSSVPSFTSGHNYNMYFTIQDDVSFQKFDTIETARKGDPSIIIEVNIQCCGDVKVDFGCRSIMGKESMFQFWFNTFFVCTSETADLNSLHRIGSRKSQEEGSVQTGAIIIQNNNNNILRRTSFRTGGSTYSSSFCEADLGSCGILGGHAHSENKSLLRPEMKKELITRAFMFMQKGHRSHQANIELSNQGQVLTSFKPRDMRLASNGVGQVSLEGNLLTCATSGEKKSPSSPRLFSRHNRSRNNINEDAGLHPTHPSPLLYKTLVLPKSELDKASKDKQHKIFPADFAVTLYFTTCTSVNIYSMDSTSIQDSDGDDDDDVSDDDDDGCKIIV